MKNKTLYTCRTLFIGIIVGIMILSCSLGDNNGGGNNNSGSNIPDIPVAYFEAIQTPSTAVDGLDAMAAVAVSPDGNNVYVVGYDKNALAVFDRDASTGILTYKAVFKDGQGGVDGLDGALDVIVSPDGKSVYVSSLDENAVAVFNRDTSTGALTYKADFKDNTGVVDGLDSVYSLVISPDNKHVYAIGQDDNAVAIFNRDVSGGASHGSLTYSKKIANGDSSGGLTVDGLNGGARFIMISSDGKNVYASSIVNHSVVVFNRDASTGDLTYKAVFKNGVGGVAELRGAAAITVSPDGKNVYVTSLSDHSIVKFTRDVSGGTSHGSLTYISNITNATTGGFRSPLYGANKIIVSADNKIVYVSGGTSSSLGVFSRNTTSGVLTYKGKISSSDAGGGLGAPRSIAISPDQKHIYSGGYSSNSLVVFNRNTADGANHGLLTYVTKFQDGAKHPDGTTGAQDVAISPDGNNVYVVGYNDGALAVFNRNSTTGVLAYSAVIKDTDTGVDGLQGAKGVSVSPDGKSVYVAGFLDKAVAVFSRNTSTGALTYKAVFKNGASGVSGLDGAESIIVSPDNKNVYVTTQADDSVVVFTRDISGGANHGTLTFSAAIKKATGPPVVNDGLNLAYGIAISPDGNHVYVTGKLDNSVVIFTRDTSGGANHGSLTYSKKITNGDVIDGTTTITGLDGPYELEISPDGKNVYVVGNNDNALVVFDRDISTGDLLYKAVFKQGVEGVDGLTGVEGVFISADGKSVYVTGRDNDTVAVFGRDVNTGELGYKKVFTNGTDGVDGLDGATGGVVSPDGKHFYVTGADDNAVVTFNRD